MFGLTDARRHLDTRRTLMSSHVSMLGVPAGSPGSGIQPEPEADESFLYPDTNTPHVRTGGLFLQEFEFGGVGAGVDGLVSSGEAVAGSSPSAWSVEQIGGVAAVAVIVPFIVVSNLLVVVSVVKCKRLQVPTNYFIVSLAAVDIFVGLVTPFVIMVEILPVQFSDLALCLAPNRVLLTGCGVSVLTLATIAYDRHTALVSPLEYVSVMTHRKIGLLVALTWLYSTAIVWAPLPVGWYSSTPPRGDLEIPANGAMAHRDAIVCSFKLLHDNAHILFLSAIFGPACVAISVCYFRIYTVARHHARAIAAVESSVQYNLRIRSIMKDAKYSMTLALVIGVFLVLWLPYLTCLLAEVVSSVQVSAWLWNYLTLLAVLNSGLNPWIYAYKNNEFRAAFRKVFKDFCACAVGYGDGALCFRKNRRSSTMPDPSMHRCSTSTVITSATFVSGSSSRHSRSSATTCGRLSDVSCSLTAPTTGEVPGREDSGGAGQKVDEGGRIPACLGNSDALSACEARFVEPLPIDYVATQRRTSDTTEQRVSSLLSADSKAFIADLLSLYLHHSVIHPEVSSSEEDGHNDSVDTEVTTHDLALPVDNLIV